jgi:nucleolar GTP-binding protein
LSQCKLFHSIKPLFNGKPTLLVINKIDVMRLEDVHPDSRALVQEIIDQEDVQCVQVSCYSEEGVMDLKNKACDVLLAHRVDNKMKGSKINSIVNRIHVAQPKPRDDVVRAPFIPEAVKQRKKYDKNDPERRRLQRDIELEEGGAGVFNINLKRSSVFVLQKSNNKAEPPGAFFFASEDYILANPEWKMDRMPEIMDGKNIADFIDPDIAEKLEALEREEEKLQAEGFYNSESDIVRLFLCIYNFFFQTSSTILTSLILMTNAKPPKQK